MKKNEKGFGVVEILLVAVIIGLLGLVGWMFYNKQKDGMTSNNNTTSFTWQTKQKEVGQTKPQEETKPIAVKTLIYPDVETSIGASGTSKDLFFTVELPSVGLYGRFSKITT